MTQGTALLRAVTALTTMYGKRPLENVREQLDIMSASELRELAMNCGALKAEAKGIARAKERQRGIYTQPPADYRGMDEAPHRGDTMGGDEEFEALERHLDDSEDVA